jgi:hypothetical protein
MYEGASQLTMTCMNSTHLNYHLATARAADIERDMQQLLVRQPSKRRRAFAAAARERRVALKARLIG